MNIIVPSVLAKDITKFEEDLDKVSGFSGKIQMDIVDGKYNIVETVTPEVLLNIETTLEIEAHLMVEEPVDWIERCAAAGITAVFGQVEKMLDKLEFISKAEEAGMRTGLAFDVNTPISGLEEWINLVDSVLLLSVPAGAQGQVFDESVLEKIKKVREMSSYVTVVIDGGINEKNIVKCLSVGGDKIEFAVGSEILNADDPETVYKKLVNISV